MLDILKRLSSMQWDCTASHFNFLSRLTEIAGQHTTPPEIQEWLLKLATSQIRSKGQAESLLFSWFEILVALGPHLQPHQDFIKKNWLPITLQKQAHTSSTLQNRVVASVLLCLCAQNLQCEDKILDRCLGFCQDIDATVRAHMAGQLFRLAISWRLDLSALKEIVTEVKHFLII